MFKPISISLRWYSDVFSSSLTIDWTSTAHKQEQVCEAYKVPMGNQRQEILHAAKMSICLFLRDFLRENHWEVSLKHNPNSWCTFVKELWFTLRVINYWGGLSFTGFSLILEVQSDNKCAHTRPSGTSWTHWQSVVLKAIIILSNEEWHSLTVVV